MHKTLISRIPCKSLRSLHRSSVLYNPRRGRGDDAEPPPESIHSTPETSPELEHLLNPSRASKTRITTPVHPFKPFKPQGSASNSLKGHRNEDFSVDKKPYVFRKNVIEENFPKIKNNRRDDEPFLPWNREKHKANLAAKQIIKENPSIDYDESPRDDKHQNTLQEGDLLDMNSSWPISRDERDKRGGFRNYNYGLSGQGKTPRNEFDQQSTVTRKLKGEALFGKYPCLMALNENRRKVFKLFLKKNFLGSNDPVRQEIVNIAEKRGISIEYCNKRVLETLSQARPHQGICMDVSHLKMETLKFKDEESGCRQVDLLLSSVHDPMNFGSMIRTAYYLGVNRIIVTSDSCVLSPVVSKASSGVLEILPIHKADELDTILELYKLKGWDIVGTQGSPKDDTTSDRLISADQIELNRNTLVLMGSEGPGLTAEMIQQCDAIISIPPGRSLHPNVDSLNVSIATGIVLNGLLSKRET